MKRSDFLKVVTILLTVGVTACSSRVEAQGTQRSGATIFEGARLITGDGSAPIENSAFIVENTRFTRVGRKGDVQVPAGAARVDLTGKTAMPTKDDLHVHMAPVHVYDGTMAKEYYTRASLIAHLERLAHHGIDA